MKKMFFTIGLLLLFVVNVSAANRWRDGLTTFFDGDTTYFNDIDTEIDDHIIEPLERYLINAKSEMVIGYSSASQITVSAGSIVCSNSTETLVEIRRNTAATTITWADIDTGSEASATTYYVYANADADATTATFKISINATSPSGVTLYKKIGSFYNDAAGNISAITNDSDHNNIRAKVSKSFETIYQALTDGIVAGYTTATLKNQSFSAYTDSVSTPTTVIQSGQSTWVSGAPGVILPISFPVRKGDYYKVTTDSGGGTLYFIPLGD